MTVDHYLIARAQARTTGEMNHTVAPLVSAYLGYDGLPDTKAGMVRLRELERRLLVFCQTGRVERPAAPRLTRCGYVAGLPRTCRRDLTKIYRCRT